MQKLALTLAVFSIAATAYAGVAGPLPDTDDPVAGKRAIWLSPPLSLLIQTAIPVRPE